MNSLKKALAGIFVLATIFVVFSCSNASDSGGKPDGNPFKGTKWEGNGRSLTFIDSDTCVYGSSLSANYERAASAKAASVDGVTYSYTWKENDDGSYTATFEIDSIVMEFTITKAGAVSGTLYMNGIKLMDLDNVDDNGESEDDNYNRYPFVDTEWVYLLNGEEVQSLSFGSKYVVMNHEDGEEFFYISEKNGNGYKARLTFETVNGFFYANFTIKSAEAEEGTLAFLSGEGGVFKRKK